jgi:phage terminase small subunit
VALTDKQQRFVDEYLKDLNATDAAIRAGYTTPDNRNSARTQGSRLLANVNISVAVSAAMTERSDRTKITSDRVLREIGRIGLVDPRKAFDQNNALLPVKEWPDEIAAAISSIKILEVRDEDGQVIGETKEIKFWDKPAALTLAARHLGMLNDKVTLDVTDELAERLARARQRLNG